MATVYGVHKIELKPGVDAEEFERFFTHEVLPVYHRVPGNVTRLVKGDRGERSGQYLILIEVESPERRDYLFPLEGEQPAEVQQLLAETTAIWEKLDTFLVDFPDPHFTDYVEVGK